MSQPLFSRLTLFALVAGLLALAVAPAAAQTSYPPETITVIGMGQAFGDPDVAYVQVGVEIGDADVNAAFSSANEVMNSVMAALREAGIAEQDLRTVSVNLYTIDEQVFGPDGMPPAPGSAQTLRTYRVSNILRVTIRDVARVGELIGVAVNAGANQIYGLEYSIADTGALAQEARVNALTDARDRAQQIADALGVTLGEATTVVEITGGGVSPVNEARFGVGGGGVPLAEGQFSVTVQMQVTFSISR